MSEIDLSNCSAWELQWLAFRGVNVSRVQPATIAKVDWTPVPPKPRKKTLYIIRTDRPGEEWQSTWKAADALGISRGSLWRAIKEGKRCVGRIFRMEKRSRTESPDGRGRQLST